MGFAIEDFSMLRSRNDLVEREGGSTPIDLVPALEDPTGPFGLRQSAR